MLIYRILNLEKGVSPLWAKGNGIANLQPPFSRIANFLTPLGGNPTSNLF
jgi:hypothetical protein